MPRKPKPQRQHKGLNDISKLERVYWSVSGPLIRSAVDNPARLTRAGLTVWPDWATWADTYQDVREAFLRTRRSGQTPAAEILYQAWLAGGDIAAARAEIARETNDPRTYLANIR